MPDADTSSGSAQPLALDDIIQLAKQLGQQQQQATPPPQQQIDLEASRPPSLLGRIGEALAGGPPSDFPMSAQDRDLAGHRALMNFGIGLMNAGPFATGGQVLAGGLQAAQQSQDYGEAVEVERQAAAQDYQQQQMTNRLELLKSALPLLQYQMQVGAAQSAMPGGGGGGGGGGASSSAIADALAGAGGDAYSAAIAGREGIGPNPRSTAAGYGQFLASTWNNFAQANPELFKGMTQEQILAARNDPAMAAKAMTWLTQQNAGALTKAGVTPSGQSLGIAHYLGPGVAAKLMGAPDTDPVSKYVSSDAVKANPELGTMTVGQMKARYAALPNPSFLGGPTTVAKVTPPPAAQPPAGPAAPSGVQMGGEPPAPPGGPTAAATAPYTGGGIGAALNAPPAAAPSAALPTPPLPPAEGIPVGNQGLRLMPGGNLSPGPSPGMSGKSADADAILRGMQARQLAERTAAPGSVLAAGPAAGPPPPAAGPAAQPGWGSVVGNYGTGAAAPPAPTPAPPSGAVPPAQPTAQPPPPPANPDVVSGNIVIKHPGDYAAFDAANRRPTPDTGVYSLQMPPGVGPQLPTPQQIAADPAGAQKMIQEHNQAQLAWQQEAVKQRAAFDSAETTRLGSLYDNQVKNYQDAQGKVLQGQQDVLKNSAQQTEEANQKQILPFVTDATKGRQVMGNIELAKQIIPMLPDGSALLSDENVRARLAKIGAMIGLPEGVEKNLGGAELWEQVINGIVGQMGVGEISGQPGGRQAAYAQFRSMLPTLLQTNEGRELSLMFVQQLAQRQIDEGSFMQRYHNQAGSPGMAPMNTRLGVPDMSGAQDAMASALGPMVKLPPPTYNPNTADAPANARYMRYYSLIPTGGRYVGYDQGSDGQLHPSVKTRAPGEKQPQMGVTD